MDSLQEMLMPYWPALWKAMICYFVVLIAIALDLWAGIAKSRKAGIKITHTYGIDRTLDKLRKRYNLLFLATIVDVVLISCEFHSTMIPYVTALAAIVFCVVEGRSILEADSDKGRYLEAAKTAAEMWKGVDKDELADLIIKKMEEKQHEKGSN